MSALVTLDGVDVTHVRRADSVVALDAVSLQIARGTAVAVVGPSGSGKTTLLDVLVGWRRPDRGTSKRDPSLPDDWRGISIVPQTLGLLDELTLRQNIALARTVARPGPGAERMEIESVARNLRIDLLLDRRPGETSLGEQQRATVARAVITRPLLLVADEPTAHQDEANALGVAAVIASITERGGAAIVATHDDRILDGFDRVLRLDDGRLSAVR